LSCLAVSAPWPSPPATRRLGSDIVAPTVDFGGGRIKGLFPLVGSCFPESDSVGIGRRREMAAKDVV